MANSKLAEEEVALLASLTKQSQTLVCTLGVVSIVNFIASQILTSVDISPPGNDFLTN